VFPKAAFTHLYASICFIPALLFYKYLVSLAFPLASVLALAGKFLYDSLVTCFLQCKEVILALGIIDLAGMSAAGFKRRGWSDNMACM
jgi:hypothetical protein